MNYGQLKTELELPEFEGLTAAQCAELLNDESGTERIHVNREVAANWLLKNGVWDKLEVASTSNTYPDVLRARIRTFFVTLQNTSLLNFENFEGDMPNLVGAGIITQGDADGFMALAFWNDALSNLESGIDVEFEGVA